MSLQIIWLRSVYQVIKKFANSRKNKKHKDTMFFKSRIWELENLAPQCISSDKKFSNSLILEKKKT
jgi:hypothetical protein